MYAFSEPSYAQLAANGLTNGTNAQVAPYADAYFEYDGSHRISEKIIQGLGCSVCAGGLGDVHVFLQYFLERSHE